MSGLSSIKLPNTSLGHHQTGFLVVFFPLKLMRAGICMALWRSHWQGVRRRLEVSAYEQPPRHVFPFRLRHTGHYISQISPVAILIVSMGSMRAAVAALSCAVATAAGAWSIISPGVGTFSSGISFNAYVYSQYSTTPLRQPPPPQHSPTQQTTARYPDIVGRAGSQVRGVHVNVHLAFAAMARPAIVRWV